MDERHIRQMVHLFKEAFGDDVASVVLLLTDKNHRAIAASVEKLIFSSTSFRALESQTAAVTQQAADLKRKLLKSEICIAAMNRYISEMELRVHQAEAKTKAANEAAQQTIGFISSRGLLNECLNEQYQASADD